MFQNTNGCGDSLKQNERISSLPAETSLMIHVFSSLEHSTGCVRQPQTMSGLSSVPNGHRFTVNIKPCEPNSPASAIEHRADADSDSGFARLCFVQRCPLGTLESPLIVCGCRTHPVECSKLEKTWIIRDVSAGREEILSFCFKESPHPFVFWNIYRFSLITESISLPVQWLF